MYMISCPFPPLAEQTGNTETLAFSILQNLLFVSSARLPRKRSGRTSTCGRVLSSAVRKPPRSRWKCCGRYPNPNSSKPSR